MVERWTSRGDQKAAEVGGWVQRFGRCRYSDLIGVVMAALGVAAFYQLAHVDPIWRVASMMAVGIVAAIGAFIFFSFALRDR